MTTDDYVQANLRISHDFTAYHEVYFIFIVFLVFLLLRFMNAVNSHLAAEKMNEKVILWTLQMILWFLAKGNWDRSVEKWKSRNFEYFDQNKNRQSFKLQVMKENSNTKV